MSQASARYVAAGVLTEVFKRGVFADNTLATARKRHKLPQVEKALLSELVHGTLRWRGYLDWILKEFYRGDFSKCPVKLRVILEMSLFQLSIADKIPDYAAVSSGVDLAKRAGGDKWGKLVNAILRNYLRKRDDLVMPALENGPADESISVRYSHPKWLVRRWLEQYGIENTVKYCEYNNRRPTLSLRVNTMLTTPDELAEDLRKIPGVEVVVSQNFGDFMRVTGLTDLNTCPLFRQGHFAIQDESTALASTLLAPEPEDTVLDMCAAPGGKTCHLAHLMQDSGRIIAADISESRLARVQENIDRLRLTSIETLVADSSDVALTGIDKILIDAPCSGLGVLGRRSDLRWHRQPADIENIRLRQWKILENAGRILRSGGFLVYSTCTLEPEETETLVEEFLDLHPEFCRLNRTSLTSSNFDTDNGYYRSLPFLHQMDGGFVVKLKKL